MNRNILLLVIASFLTSCGKEEVEVDLALQEKYEKQQALLEKTQAELDQIKEKVQKIRVVDPASDLDEVQKQVKEALAEKKKLEAEFQELVDKKEAAEKELEDYQKEYPIRRK